MKEETCDHPTNRRLEMQMSNETDVEKILVKVSIARVIGCSRPMVDGYLALGDWQPLAKLDQG